MKSHGFYACQYCFHSFSSASLAKEHRCFKACANNLCRRHVPEMANRPRLCDCITTAEGQWQQLYRLQYPTYRSPNTGQMTHYSFSAGSRELYTSANTPFWSVRDAEDANLSTSPTFTIVVAGDEHNGPSDSHREAVVAEMGTPQLFAHVRTLQQRTLQLEQRLAARPSQREDDLEITLANVWQAFRRTGSSEAQQDSPLWRLVRRHAPNVLSREMTHSAAQDATVLLPTTSMSDELDAFDWSRLLADESSQVSSWKGPTTDSGYTSFSGA